MPTSQLDTQQILQDCYDATNHSIKVDTNVVVGTVSIQVASAIIFNKKTVTTAGTRVQLSALTTTISGVVIKALAANTGKIYVGDVTVASTNGFELSAGDSVSIAISALNSLYLDSSVNGEGITFLAS